MRSLPPRRLLWIVLTLQLLAPRLLWAQSEDPLALAALLLRDGSVSRAALVLQEIDPTAKGVDRVRYFSLSGLVALEERRFSAAAEAFAQAIAASSTPNEAEPTLYLYRARAQLLGEDAEGALETLSLGSGSGVDGLPSAWLIRARSLHALGRLPEAYGALVEGGQRFPEQRDFPRQQVLLLVELGLTREAGEQAAALLSGADATAEDSLVIGEALRRGGSLDRAAVVLEAARLRFPAEIEIVVRQAAVAVDAGQPLTAARFLQTAAALDPAYAHDAAELYRRAGQIEAALYMNALVTDPTEKVRQRLGILLAAERYEHAAALTERLHRLGILQGDDEMAYGLAYAHFRIGALEAAEALLKPISDPALFQKATALRQAMARCAENPVDCS